MRLDRFIIAFLVFGFVVFGTLFVFTDITQNYGLNITTDEFTSTYNQINATYDLSQDIQGRMLEGDIEGGDASWESMVKSSYSSIRLIGSTFRMIGSMMADISETLGLPLWVTTFAMAALSVMVIFSLIFMIFRFKG